MDKLVLISPPDRRNLQKALRRVDEGPLSWTYLGQSIEEYQLAGETLGRQGRYLESSHLFHQASEDLRGPYLTYLYDIGSRLNSLLLWVTSLSYRSVYVSRTFAQACHLKVGFDLARDWEGPGALLLVAGERPVRRALRVNLAVRKQARVESLGGSGESVSFQAATFIKLLVRRAFFVLREGRRMFLARRIVRRPHASGEPTTLMVSSVSPRNTDRGTEFHTFFFGDLAHKLRDWGNRVALMPLVLRDVPYQQKIAQLTKAPFPVYVPHRYLTVADLLKTTLRTFKKPPMPRPVPSLEGMDVSPLVEDDLRNHWMSNRAGDNLLLADALRRMAQSGSSFERIIYVYENQPWERAMCWQVRRTLPGTALVGYQHSRAPRMLLNLHLAPGGERAAPLPDRIVTVGRHTAKMFSSDGYQPGQVRAGGALHTPGIQASDAAISRPPPTSDDPAVLVAPSMGREEARELVDAAVKLFDEDAGIRIVIKCHPTMSFHKIMGDNGIRLPQHVKVSNEPIDTLMARSSVMVYTGSTVCIQALAMELPVVHLRPRFSLDLDPFEGEDEARFDALNPAELRERVGAVLQDRQSHIDQRRKLWMDLVKDMHGPVTEETYLAFVGP